MSTHDAAIGYLLDHDPASREAITSLLTAGGADVRPFPSAEAFLAGYVADERPACIVCDARLADIAGVELIDRLRRRGITHPVILTAAPGDAATIVGGFRAGVFDVILKPISGPRLVARWRDAVGHDRRHGEIARLRRETLAAIETLSARERQVMERLFEGVPNKTIAYELAVSEKTVAAHRAHILAKMGAASLPLLVRQLTVARLADGHEPFAVHRPIPSLRAA